MASSITPTLPTRAEWMFSGVHTNGSTVLRKGVTRLASGGAATMNTTNAERHYLQTVILSGAGCLLGRSKESGTSDTCNDRFLGPEGILLRMTLEWDCSD